MIKPICVCGKAYEAHNDDLQIPGHCDGYDELRNVRVYLFTCTTEQEFAEIKKYLESHPGVSGIDLI